jgi:hypothetical protein
VVQLPALRRSLSAVRRQLCDVALRIARVEALMHDHLAQV